MVDFTRPQGLTLTPAPHQIIQPLITRAGVNAMGSGPRREGDEGNLRVTFTHFELGALSYNPTVEQTRLRDEHSRRYEIADSRWMAGNRLHLTLAITDDQAFDVGEIGIIANETILFAVQSQEGVVITRKLKREDLLLSFDLTIDAATKEHITVAGVGERLNLSVAGELSEIASSITKLAGEQLHDRERLAALERRILAIESRLNA